MFYIDFRSLRIFLTEICLRQPISLTMGFTAFYLWKFKPFLVINLH